MTDICATGSRGRHPREDQLVMFLEWFLRCTWSLQQRAMSVCSFLCFFFSGEGAFIPVGRCRAARHRGVGWRLGHPQAPGRCSLQACALQRGRFKRSLP